MDGLSAAASVIAVLQLTQAVVSALSEYHQSARGAHREIKALAATLGNLEALLKHHEEKIGSVTSSSVILGSLSSELDELRQKLEPLEAAGKSKHGLKSWKISLKWPFKKDDVAERMRRIDSLNGALVMELGIDTLDVSRGNSAVLAQLTEKIQLAQDDKQRRSVVSWLSNSVPDTSLYHVKARQRHEKATGEWSTSSDELQAWITAPNSFLWLKGGAGAGKTILCSTIIDYLQDHCQLQNTDSFSVVVFWYFSFADEKTQSVRNFLCSIVRDLCNQTLHLPDAVLDSFARHNNGQQGATIKDLFQMFRSLVPGFDHVYLIADALDECPQSELCRDDLLKGIHEIRDSDLDCLHFLTTSRDEVDIRLSFRRLEAADRSFAVLEAQGVRVQEDIEKFLESQLQDDKYAKWSSTEKANVITTLADQADGMFRLIALQLNILSASRSQKMRREALKQMPKTLDAVYDRMLENVLKEDKEMVRRTFFWLAFSARPVTVDQLMEAVLVEPVHPYFDIEARFDDEEAFLSMFPAGLIRTLGDDEGESEYDSNSTIYEDSSTSETTAVSSMLEDDESGSDQSSESPFDEEFPTSETAPTMSKKPTVQFAHFSVQEFLLSNRMKDKSYKLEDQSGHVLILENCLSYVLFVDADNLEISEKLAEDFPLLFYACKCWHYHRRILSHKASTPALEELLQKWLNSDSILKIWLNFGLVQKHSMRNEPVYSFFTELVPRSTALDWDFARESYYTFVEYHHQRNSKFFDKVLVWLAFLGMSQELEAFRNVTSSTGYEMDQSNDQQFKEPLGSVLHAASLGGSLPVMEQLLNWNLNINMVEGHYGTALQAAAAWGHKNIVDLLLKRGAKANIMGGYYGTALQAAALRGRVDIMEVLHQHGADLNHVGGAYKTASRAAIYSSNHQEVLAFLLQHGCDFTIGNPLHTAANFENLSAMRFLLDQGCDIEGYDANGSTPLQTAATQWTPTVVSWLLENGCNIHAISRNGKTALQLAVEAVRFSNVEFLLEAGASVDPVAGEQGSSLLSALEKREWFSGHRYGEMLQILEMFLNKGAGFEHVQLALERARLREPSNVHSTREAHRLYMKFITKAISILEEAEYDHIYHYQGIRLLFT